MIRLSSASRGRPSSRTRRPAAACSGWTTNSTTSAPSLRIAAGSVERTRAAPPRRSSPPARRANGSNVVPWSTVDTTTAKKTMLKNSTLCGHALDDRERREHHRHRAAQPRPAEHQPLAQREAGEDGRDQRRQRARDHGDDERERRRLQRDLVELDGKTSSPRSRNIASWATHARPSWKVTIVRLRRYGDAAEGEPGEVDREEARAVQDCPRRRRPARRTASEATGYRPAEASRTRWSAWTASQPAATPTDGRPELAAREQPGHVQDAVARLLDPRDEPEHEQDRDGIVEARLALERAGHAPAQRRAPQDGEDRRAVRRGQHRAEQHPLEWSRGRAATPRSRWHGASTIVPTKARLSAGPSTGRISCQPAASPPSKRIRASAMIPTVRASR